jgi:hypothetical protein
MIRRWMWALCAVVSSGCFNSSSVTPFVTGIGSPGIQGQEFPAAVATGATSTTVTGENFTATTSVLWNRKPLKTTFQSETQVQIAFSGSETNLAGTAEVIAVNDDDLTSPPFTASIVDAALQLTSVSPQVIPPGSQDTTLTLTGQGFRPTSRVQVDGQQLATTLVSSTSLTAVIPAARLVNPTQLNVQVAELACPLGGDGFCSPASNRVLVGVGTSASDFRVMPGEVVGLASAAGQALVLISTLTFPNSSAVSAVDPVAGQVTATVTTANLFPDLAVSSGDQFLYASGGVTPVRYVLPGLTAAVPLSSLSSSATILPAPGAPLTVAFYDFNEIGILDGTTPRPNQLSTFNDGASTVFWGADATALYGIGGDLRLFALDANGVTKPGTVLSSPSPDLRGQIVFDRTNSRIDTSEGQTFDAVGGTERDFGVVTLPSSTSDCTLALDEGLGKAFFACPEQGLGLTVRSFDLHTMQMLGRIMIPTNNFDVVTGSIVRWGQNGLAIGASNGLYLYSGAFVH